MKKVKGFFKKGKTLFLQDVAKFSQGLTFFIKFSLHGNPEKVDFSVENVQKYADARKKATEKPIFYPLIAAIQPSPLPVKNSVRFSATFAYHFLMFHSQTFMAKMLSTPTFHRNIC